MIRMRLWRMRLHIGMMARGFCAKFVSDCLYAGGLSCAYTSSGNPYRSASLLWGALPLDDIPVYKLNASLTKDVKMSQNADRLSAGDPIFWRCSTCGRTPHVVLCGGQDANGLVTQYAHNDPKNNEKLNFYIITCSKCQVNCDLYVRHISVSEPTGRINVDY